jgi:hypothetical protein
MASAVGMVLLIMRCEFQQLRRLRIKFTLSAQERVRRSGRRRQALWSGVSDRERRRLPSCFEYALCAVSAASFAADVTWRTMLAVCPRRYHWLPSAQLVLWLLLLR